MHSRYVNCPHCGRRVGFFRRIEKCALTGELVCTSCIVNSRFSDSVAFDVPLEYREKFRFFNVLPTIIAITIILWMFGSAWPSFVGWDAPYFDRIFQSLGSVIAQWGIGIILILLSAKLPHLGTWMFYHWIEQDNNKDKVQKALEANRRGEYETEDKIYAFKMQVINFLKRTKLNFLYYSTALAALLSLIFFFIIPRNYKLGGTYISAFAGVIYVYELIAAFLTFWAASAFYSSKDPQQQNRIQLLGFIKSDKLEKYNKYLSPNQRYILELGQWLYVILLPAVFLTFILGWLIKMELGDFTEGTGWTSSGLFLTHKIIFAFQQILLIGICYILLKAKPNFDWENNDKNKRKIEPKGLFWTHRILKSFIIVMLLISLLTILVLSFELLMVDFAMFFCVTSYYLILVYFVVIFSILKLVKRKPTQRYRYKTFYWTLVKISTVIIVINLLPTIGTQVYTNPSLDKQFSNIFGKDWKDQVSAEDKARLRQVKYSAFDAYFGYEVPIKAQYENVYMYDHPRYVKDRATGEILSNGSAKFENITHAMIFDAYLPATDEFKDLEFGGDSDVKLPVVIYLHGIGMDRGAGNANWTSQYIANLGYAVFDMSYGFTGWADYPYTSGKERGYDFPDTIQQIGQFTKFLAQSNNSQYFHADVSKTFFAGRSFGGWMVLACAFLAESTFAGGNYSSQVDVKGVIPFYPASDIPNIGSEYFQLGETLGLVDEGAPYIRGSSNPDDPDFNPEWLWYNPHWVMANTKPRDLPIIFGIQGMHDYLVPQGATQRLEKSAKAYGHPMIAGYYPFGSHGFDALHWSQYGQSIMYYEGYFLALTKNR